VAPSRLQLRLLECQHPNTILEIIMFSLRSTAGLPALALLVLVLAVVGGCSDRGLLTATVPAAPQRLLVPDNGFEAISAGYIHTCALRNGSLVCWGDNGEGQTDVPAGLTDVTQVSAAGYYTCARSSNGTIACWGYDLFGQVTVPAGLTDVAQVSAGLFHACARRNDDTVVCWGQSDYGQTAVPVGLAGVAEVDAGGFHTCARRNDGTVICWGRSDYGQTAVPAGLADIAQISAGEFHNCARRNDGTAVCWGYNGEGQTNLPAGLTDVTQLSAGAYHSCARSENGGFVCWGRNSSGQTAAPAGLTTVAQVSGGGYHSCALDVEGTPVCWGDGGVGQTTVPASRVDPVGTFSATPAQVLAGNSFALSITDAHVPGFAGPANFTYAFDCGDGSGYGAFGPSGTATCATSSVGSRTVGGRIRDAHGDEAAYATTVHVVAGFTFTGFFPPIENLPKVNVVRAGSAIPVKFSLNGDRGLAIMADGYPKSVPVQCDAAAPQEAVDQTVTAGSSSLSYDGADDRYNYVWKTEKSWTNCRELQVRLTDGSVHTALFRFAR
jgi:alpha-tubulin suppressor-like RCC1 family protein